MKNLFFSLVLLALFGCEKNIGHIECNVWLIQHDDSQKLATTYIAADEDEVALMCEEYAEQYKAICSVWCDCE